MSHAVREMKALCWLDAESGRGDIPLFMKKNLIPVCVILGILVLCLLSHSSHKISAYPENLWTSGGQFSEPSETRAVLDWNRTEYGVLWAWLVHDSCTSESAWYMRIEPRSLVLYVAGALLGGLVSIFLISPGKNQLKESPVSSSDEVSF